MKNKIFLILILFLFSLNLITPQGLIDDSRTLTNLDDVLINNPIESQTLLYNSTSTFWVNAFLNDSSHSVNNSILWDGHVYGDEGHWGINGNDIFYNDGNVGIGTTNPVNALTVIGEGNFTGDIFGNSFIVQNLSSIFFGQNTINFTAKMEAQEVTVEGSRRTTVTIDSDMVVLTNINITHFVACINVNSGTGAGCAISAVNDVGGGMSLFTPGSNVPIIGGDSFLFGDSDNLDLTQVNGTIRLGFNSGEITDAIGTTTGFFNKFNVMILTNESTVDINGTLNVSSNISTQGNITLGEKLVFKFGQMIDNLVDGWLRITGNLNVTETIHAADVISQGLFDRIDNVTQIDSDTIFNLTLPVLYAADTTNNEIDINITFGTNASFQVWDAARKFNQNSVFVNILNSDGVTIDHEVELNTRNKAYQFFFNGTFWFYAEIGKGEFSSISSFHSSIADFGNLIQENDNNSEITVIGSLQFTGVGIGSQKIISFVPTSQLESNANWKGVFIDGDLLDPIGEGADIVGFEVDFSGVNTTNDPVLHGVEITVPPRFDAIHIHEGQLVINNQPTSIAATEFSAMDIRVDTVNLNSSSVWSAMGVTAVGDSNGTIAAVLARNKVDPIRQEVANFIEPSQTEFAGRKTGGGVTWADGIDGFQIFTVVGDEVYIGSSAQFSQIEVIMGTVATADVQPTFWYNTAADTWTQFFPDDETSGFQSSSLISWKPNSISSSWTNDGDPGAGDTTSGYWIKMIRVRVADIGTPIPATMKTGTVEAFGWDQYGVLSIRNLTVTESFTTTGNLTIGDKITFNLGESIDNIIDGWIKVTGNLDVTGNTGLTVGTITGRSGDLTLKGAVNSPTGGHINFNGGIGGNNGGSLKFITGSGNNNAGDFEFTASESPNGEGGKFTFIAGLGAPEDGSGAGGGYSFTAGDGGFNSGDGGSFYFETGTTQGGSGVSGSFTIDIGVDGGGGVGNIILAETNGNVGIGRTSPGAKLDINGTTSISGDFTVNTNNLFVDVSTGRVGIGTTTPTQELDVNGSVNISESIYITDNLTLGQKIVFALGGFIQNIISGQVDINGTLNVTNNLIIENNLTVDTNTLFVDSDNNNVGIGTKSPSYKLDVDGNILSSGAYLFYDGSTQNTGSTPDGIGFHPSTISSSLESFSLANQDTVPLAIFVRADGLKLYMTGNENIDIFEYNMTVPWDVSTLAFVSTKIINVGAPRGLYFKPDGTKFYVGRFTAFVLEYTMTTPWNVTTASQTGVLAVSGGLQSLSFKADGTSLYVLDGNNNLVKQYDMTTPWDVDTASDPSISFDYSNQFTGGSALTFRSDGRSMYAAGGTTLFEYELTTPWDITTARLINSGTVVNGQFIFNPDGTKSIGLDRGTDLVHSFDLGIIIGGNVGIGTSSITQRLEVNGSVNITNNLYIGEDITVSGLISADSITISNDFLLGSDLIFVDKSNGVINFGSFTLGTDVFNVFAPTTGVQTGITSFYDSSNNIKFRIKDEWTAGSIPPLFESHSSLGFGLLTTQNAPFIWYVDGTNNEKMRLTSTGLGIGTTTPQNALNVIGDLNITGNTFYGGNITLANGGLVYDNATCTFLVSPDGSTQLEVCNN